MVFADKARKEPWIVVECKREEASQGELTQAIEQGFGYANSLRAHFLWVASSKDDYFNVWEHVAGEREKNRLADLPLG